jgi:hypothetical protein
MRLDAEERGAMLRTRAVAEAEDAMVEKVRREAEEEEEQQAGREEEQSRREEEIRVEAYTAGSCRIDTAQ